MSSKVQSPVSVASVFLWIGFVCAISFMEAWLKFRAPGITLPLGLGIGRLVFGALNKVEWVFALSLLFPLLSGRRFMKASTLLYLLAIIILIVQSLWMLPTLDARAEMYMQGITPPPSNIHCSYVGAEFVKVASLFIYAITLFKQNHSRTPFTQESTQRTY